MCANYAEFWGRWADWTAKHHGHAAAADALTPVVTTHMPGRVDLALRQCREWELAGNAGAARAAFKALAAGPGKGLVQVAMKFSNFERRAGGVPAGADVLQTAVDGGCLLPCCGEGGVLTRVRHARVFCPVPMHCAEAIGDAKAYLVLQLVHYLEHTAHDAAAAKAALQAALKPESCAASATLWQAYVAFERRHAPTATAAAAITAVFKEGLACEALHSKDELWMRYMDHVESTSSSAAEVEVVEQEYQTWNKAQQAAPSATNGKRANGAGTDADAAAAKMPRSDAAGAGAGAGAPAAMMAQGGGAYDYTAQQQAAYYQYWNAGGYAQ